MTTTSYTVTAAPVLDEKTRLRMAHVVRLCGSIKLSARRLESCPTAEAAQLQMDRMCEDLYAMQETVTSLEGLISTRLETENSLRTLAEAAAAQLTHPASTVCLHEMLTEGQQRLQVMQETYLRPLALPAPSFLQAFEEATNA